MWGWSLCHLQSACDPSYDPAMPHQCFTDQVLPHAHSYLTSHKFNSLT